MCTDEDLARFYKPNEGSERHVKSLIEKKNLFCIDLESNDYNLGGHRSLDKFDELDIMAVPC